MAVSIGFAVKVGSGVIVAPGVTVMENDAVPGVPVSADCVSKIGMSVVKFPASLGLVVLTDAIVLAMA